MGGRTIATILTIFLIALLLRTGYIFLDVKVSKEVDSVIYDIAAINILNASPFDNARRPPLYPYYLALIYKVFGISPLAIELSQALVGAFSCIVVFYIAKIIFNEKTGLAAAWLMAVSPPLIFYSALRISETLTYFIFTLSALFLIMAYRSIRRMYECIFLIIGGIFMGFLTLLRAEMLYLPVFIVISFCFLLKDKKRLSYFVVLFLVASTALPCLWSYINYKKYHKFIGVAVGTGRMLWFMTNPDDPLDRESIQPIDVKDSIEYNEELRREGLRYLTTNPFYIYPKLFAKKFFRFWISGHNYFISGLDVTLPSSIKLKLWSVFTVKSMLLLYNSAIVILAFVSIIYLVVKQGLSNMWVFIVLPIFYKMLVHSVVYSSPRYQIHIYPFILIFAAFSLVYSDKKRLIFLTKDAKFE